MTVSIRFLFITIIIGMKFENEKVKQDFKSPILN